MVRRFFLGLMVLAGSSTCTASAPPGRPPKDASEAFAKATQVFVGKVESVSQDPLGFNTQATVRIQRTLKGTRKGVVSVSGQGGPTYPARVFRPGQVLLFYLADDLHADSFMNRVVEGADIQKDVKQLKLSK